jgi:hypothetical protein
MTRALCRAADGRWRERRTQNARRRVYTLEVWQSLTDGRVLVLHPEHRPKVVHPNGRVEEIAPAPISLS